MAEVQIIENKHRSAGEAASVAVAEENRELSWKSKSFMASMFMGDFDFSLAYPFPEQDPDDRRIGDEICQKVDEWCATAVDGDAIDKAQEIPAPVWKGLNELGLFGIKIPKEYGGLGMSQTNYTRILSVIARHCGSVAATLSAHQSIGVPQPLKLVGTKEQKEKYLPLIAKGAVTAFALTEPGVGSDPANMITEAKPSEDGSHYILNGLKLWCTNGTIADFYVVMARTPDRLVRGKMRKQISAFVVDARAEGIEVLHRCRFMGIRAIENGLIRFKDVKVPASDLLGNEGEGLKIALSTLNDGRLSIPAISAQTAIDMTPIAASWAKGRVQWGQSVGAHEAGADKLARLAAGGYAMKALSDFACALSDRGNVDIRMEAASAKAFGSEVSWDLVDTALQLRGGRGFEQESSLEARGETAWPVERAMRDARINRIVEGTTDIMHLFLAREALDKHLRLAGGLFAKGGIGKKLKTVVEAAKFYATWYPKLWWPFATRSYAGFHPKLAGHLRWVERRTRKMARELFHQMALRGPKLEKRQLILGRIVDLGTELAVMGLVASRAQTELNRGERDNLNTALYWLTSARLRVDDLFRGIWSNADVAATKLAQELMDKAQPMPEAVIPELSPISRDYGSDLTSGRQTERGGPVAAAEDEVKAAS